MMRISSVVCATALVTGCAIESSSSEQEVEITADGCVKIEGSEIGQQITIEVPDGSGGTVSVTFVGWTQKDGEPNEFVGFTLDADAMFTVKAGQDIFAGSGFSFMNPFGTGGRLVKGISFVEICEAEEDKDPPPPVEPCTHDCPDPKPDPDPEDKPEDKPDDCDKNHDGDSTDEGECDHVPDDMHDCP